MKNQPPNPPRAKHGMQRIDEERQRQVTVERWTSIHDDRYVDGELAAAADCYEQAGDLINEKSPCSISASDRWPWSVEWWKPAASAERNYEKAGALFKAETDRLLRAGKGAEAVLMERNAERVAAKLDSPCGTAPSKPKEKKK